MTQARGSGWDSVGFGATECAKESMDFRSEVTAVPADSRHVSNLAFGGPAVDGFQGDMEKRGDVSHGQKFFFGVAVHNCMGFTPQHFRRTLRPE